MTRADKLAHRASGAILADVRRIFGRCRSLMKNEEDDAPRRPAPFEIGQPLDLLSLAEIDERIERLRQEIARLEAARAGKQAASAAADAFFRK
jgi:uncharacterized small protein (DUF1192 family)